MSTIYKIGPDHKIKDFLPAPNIRDMVGLLTSRFNGTWFKSNKPIPNSFKQVNLEGEDMTTETITTEPTHTTNDLDASKLTAGVISTEHLPKPFIQGGDYTKEFVESFKEALRYLKEVTLMGLVASGQINQKTQDNKQQAIALIHEELKEFFEAKRDSDIVDALVDTIVTDMGFKLRFGGYEKSTYTEFSPVPYLNGFAGTENDEVDELKDELLGYEGLLDFPALNLLCKYGWKVIEAIRLIAANNSSKFVSDNDPECHEIISKSKEMYLDKGVVITPVYNKEYNCWALMDGSNKYKKSYNFKSVDQEMQELFPDELPGWYLNCVKQDIPEHELGMVQKGTEISEPFPSVLDVQEGGQHYKSQKIQPIEYINSNGLTFFEGNNIKYVTRHRSKNGAQDIKKAMHYLQMILEFEYKIKSKVQYEA